MDSFSHAMIHFANGYTRRYQGQAEPVLFNVGLGVGFVLLLAQVMPGLSSFVSSQTPAGPVRGDMSCVDGRARHCRKEMRSKVEGEAKKGRRCNEKRREKDAETVEDE